MKNIVLLLLIPISLVPFAFAQKEDHKFKESVKVVAKLTAYDFSESQSNISNAPSQYTLIFEILNPLKTRKKSKYIKAIYRSFGTENANNLILSNAEKLFRLKLSRQNDCDMSMMEMESKGASFTDSSEKSNTDTSKLKFVGLTYFRSVIDNEKKVLLPCFNLTKVIK